MKTISVYVQTALGQRSSRAPDPERAPTPLELLNQPPPELKMDMADITPTADVAQAFVTAYLLPDNVPWGLRTGQGEFLDDNAPIGSHAGKDESVHAILTPKAHLG